MSKVAKRSDGKITDFYVDGKRYAVRYDESDKIEKHQLWNLMKMEISYRKKYMYYVLNNNKKRAVMARFLCL